MARTRRLTQLLDDAREKTTLPGDGVVVALSGGADSAALALIVLHGGVSVRLVHVNHGLAASPTMGEAARDIAECLALPIEILSVQVGTGPSPEDQARDARYNALTTIDGSVLTAHTRDDNAETLMINLLRGTGSAGLAGIPAHRAPNIYRPILEVTRSETREIATLGGLPFRDDPMNHDLSLTRNRIRRDLLPLMAEYNPQVVAALARAAKSVEADSAYLDRLTPTQAREGVPAGLVETLPRPLGDRLLADLLDRHRIGITSDRLERMRQVSSGAAQRQDLADGLTVRRDGAMVVIE